MPAVSGNDLANQHSVYGATTAHGFVFDWVQEYPQPQKPISFSTRYFVSMIAEAIRRASASSRLASSGPEPLRRQVGTRRAEMILMTRRGRVARSLPVPSRSLPACCKYADENRDGRPHRLRRLMDRHERDRHSHPKFRCPSGE